MEDSNGVARWYFEGSDLSQLLYPVGQAAMAEHTTG
jgi:hypothetical protein